MLCQRLIKKQTSEVYFDGEHKHLKEQSIICIIVIWQSIIWSTNNNNSHLLEKKQKYANCHLRWLEYHKMWYFQLTKTPEC